MTSSNSLLLATLAFGITVGSAAQAQVAHMLTELAPLGNNAVGHRVYMPSAAFPRGDSSADRSYRLGGLTTALAANPIDQPGVPGVRDGGISVSQLNGDVWTVATDLFYLGPCGGVPAGPCGFARQTILTLDAHPDYGPAVPQSQNINALLGGNSATGIAIDTSNTSGIAPQVLFVVDTASQLHFLAPTIPSAVLAPPVTLATGSPSQLTGVAYDPATTSIWVSTLNGTVYQATIGGAVFNRITPSNPTFLANGAQAFGIGYSSSNGLGSIAAPACSQQVQGEFNVCVVDFAGNIYDVNGPGFIAAPPGIRSVVLGLGISADQQDLGGADPNANTRLDIDAPLTNGFPASNFVISGLVPGATGVLAFDLCPLIIPAASPFGSAWLDALSPTLNFVPFGPANAAGNVVLPGAAFIGAPPGIQLTFQAFALNPGTSFSNGAVMTVGLR